MLGIVIKFSYRRKVLPPGNMEEGLKAPALIQDPNSVRRLLNFSYISSAVSLYLLGFSYKLFPACKSTFLACLKYHLGKTSHSLERYVDCLAHTGVLTSFHWNAKLSWVPHVAKQTFTFLFRNYY